MAMGGAWLAGVCPSVRAGELPGGAIAQVKPEPSPSAFGVAVTLETDVLVYDSSPAGIIAAIAAAGTDNGSS